MILVDTSVWIEFDRGSRSSSADRLDELIRADGDVAVTEPVLMEVVVGARNNLEAARLRKLLNRFQLLPFESPVDIDAATRIYSECRASGVTPRGPVDCMIAAVASRTGSSLLSHDVDLARIAAVVGIGLDQGSLEAT